MVIQRTTEELFRFGRVEWNKAEGGFAPRYKWKSIIFDGPARPMKAFLEGERLTILRYFMCRISEHLFNAAPLQMVVHEETGAFTFERDALFDSLPYLKETEDGFEMSDGSMAISLAGDDYEATTFKEKQKQQGHPKATPDDSSKDSDGMVEYIDEPQNWTEDYSHEDGCSYSTCVCGKGFLGKPSRETCKECHDSGPVSGSEVAPRSD